MFPAIAAAVGGKVNPSYFCNLHFAVQPNRDILLPKRLTARTNFTSCFLVAILIIYPIVQLRISPNCPEILQQSFKSGILTDGHGQWSALIFGIRTDFCRTPVALLAKFLEWATTFFALLLVVCDILKSNRFAAVFFKGFLKY